MVSKFKGIFFFYVLGCCYAKPLLVPGGRAFIWPTLQSVQR